MMVVLFSVLFVASLACSETTNCKKGERLVLDCPFIDEPTCFNPISHEPNPATCTGVCWCDIGTVRNDITNACVKKVNCPKKL